VELTVEQRRAMAMAAARMRAAAAEEQTRRAVSGMSEQELAAAAYEQPAPPPGVNIHMGDGTNMLSKGGGQLVQQTQNEALARAERERNGQSADVAESLLRGVPFAGEFTPRLIAGGMAATGNGSYADNLAMEQARTRTFDEDSPLTSTGAKVAGAVGSTLAAAPAAAGSSVAQTLLGVGGKTLPQAMVRGGIAGAAQGLASGAGSTEDLTNVPQAGMDAGKSGLIGLGLGTFIPAAVGGVGQLVDKAMNSGKDALSPLARQTRSFLERQFLDPARVQAQKADIATLGPNGMLADVSPEWQMVARGAAARPGSRSPVVDALRGRDAGKNARLGQTVDAELGPAPTPSWQDARIKGNQQALGPYYDRSLAGQPPIDVNVGLLQRVDDALLNAKGEEKAVLGEIRDTLLLQNGQPDINARGVHGTRKALDLLSEKYQANPKKGAIIAGFRSDVDKALKGTVERFGRLDKAYAEMANQREMLDKGQTVFDTGRSAIRPEELNTVLTNNRPASNRMLSAGARAEVDRIVGTNANDVAKLNQLLKGEGDWNRDKLRMLFGQEKADKVLNVLDAERRMEGTFRTVVGGSQTAPTAEFADFLRGISKGKEVPMDTTLTGAATRGVQKVANMLMKSGADEKADLISRELAKLSVATGGDRDAIIQALLQRGVRQSQLQKFYDVGGAGGPILSPVANALAGSDRR